MAETLTQEVGVEDEGSVVIEGLTEEQCQSLRVAKVGDLILVELFVRPAVGEDQDRLEDDIAVSCLGEDQSTQQPGGHNLSTENGGELDDQKVEEDGHLVGVMLGVDHST